MKLPNAEQAFVDVRKLRDYCFSTEHPRGQHKARVFRVFWGGRLTRQKRCDDAS